MWHGLLQIFQSGQGLCWQKAQLRPADLGGVLRHLSKLDSSPIHMHHWHLCAAQFSRRAFGPSVDPINDDPFKHLETDAATDKCSDGCKHRISEGARTCVSRRDNAVAVCHALAEVLGSCVQKI